MRSLEHGVVKFMVFFLLLFIPVLVLAQGMLPGDVPCPTTASLGKYGDIPMSYYTGNANVSIPLYSMKIRDVELNISLSYDGSGVQLNSLPGWMGHNWTLQAGGMIMRTAQRRYDEFVFPEELTKSMSHKPVNYYKSLKLLPQMVKESANNFSRLKDNAFYDQYDMSADIFTFNFMGKTGKFFLDNDGKWRVLSDENLDVIFDYNDESNFIYPFISRYPRSGITYKQPKTIKGFKIRDDNGTLYEFGGTTNAIEYAIPFFRTSINEDCESWKAVSWYLTKVSDKYGNVLYTFEYDRGYFLVNIYNIYSYHRVSGNDAFIFGSGFEAFSGNGVFPYNFSKCAPVYLSKIKGNNGVNIRFIRNPSSSYQSLFPSLYTYGYMELYGELVKHVYGEYSTDTPIQAHQDGAFFYLQNNIDSINKYKYGYERDLEQHLDVLKYCRLEVLENIFIETELNAPHSILKGYYFHYFSQGRLHLDNIDILKKENDSCMIEPIGKYQFKYHRYEMLPKDYLTTAVDHWGFYNGTPYQRIPTDFYGFSETRDPNPEYIKNGMLTEIIYPTGGCSVLEYEGNQHSQYLSYDRKKLNNYIAYAGGLRIRSITEYEDKEHTKMLKRRTYRYNKPGSTESSGILFMPPVYYWPNWSATCLEKGAKTNVETFMTASILPLANQFGPIIGYSYVTECDNDGNETLYHYTNLDDSFFWDERFVLDFNDGKASPFDKFSHRGFLCGKLLNIIRKDSTGNKIQSTGYTYRQDKNNVNASYTLAENLQCANYSVSVSTMHYIGGVYKMYYPKFDVIELDDTVFYNNNEVITKTIYDKRDSTMKVDFGHTHYVDIRLLNRETTYRKEAENMKVYDYTAPVSSSASKRISYMFCLQPLKITEYMNGNFIGAYISEYSQRTINERNVYTPLYYIRKNADNTADTLISYKSYTSTGALSCYKKRGEPITYLKWGFNDNYLILKGYEDVLLNISNQLCFKSATMRNKLLQTIKSHKTCTGYVYNPLYGIMCIIYPNGRIITYEYDSMGRLKMVRDNYGNILHKYEYNYRK